MRNEEIIIIFIILYSLVCYHKFDHVTHCDRGFKYLIRHVSQRCKKKNKATEIELCAVLG